MSDLTKILLTSALTVLSGLFILAVGQVAMKWFIDPLQEYKKALGRVDYLLFYWQHVYANPGVLGHPVQYEASSGMRQAAGDLLAACNAIRWPGLWQRLRAVVNRADVKEATACLIGLSDSLGAGGDPLRNLSWAEHARKHLGLKTDIT